MTRNDRKVAYTVLFVFALLIILFFLISCEEKDPAPVEVDCTVVDCPEPTDEDQYYDDGTPR